MHSVLNTMAYNPVSGNFAGNFACLNDIRITLDSEHMQIFLDQIIFGDPSCLACESSGGPSPLQIATTSGFPESIVYLLLRRYPAALLSF